jgi:hypothetical protein
MTEVSYRYGIGWDEQLRMPLVAWNTYVKHLPGHLNEDALRLVAASAFPYMEKDGRERFLRDLQGAERKPERKMTRDEYAMRVAGLGGHVKLIEVPAKEESE